MVDRPSVGSLRNQIGKRKTRSRRFSRVACALLGTGGGQPGEQVGGRLIDQKQAFGKRLKGLGARRLICGEQALCRDKLVDLSTQLPTEVCCAVRRRRPKALGDEFVVGVVEQFADRSNEQQQGKANASEKRSPGAD